MGARSYVVPAGSRPWPAAIEGPSKQAVLREVGRAVKAGELAATGPLEQLPSGRWMVPVWRVKARPVVPAWRRPVLVSGGVVLVLGGLAALGWWLAGMASAAVAGVSLPLVIGGSAALLLARAAVRRSSGCEVTVTVRHRH